MTATRWRSPAVLVMLGLAIGLAGTVRAQKHIEPDKVRPGSEQPVITSIMLEDTNVVVTVQVPAGLQRVTLQTTRRLGVQSWQPRAVQRVEGKSSELTFRIPRTADIELMRVRADVKEALPSNFYQGTNSFAGTKANGVPTANRGPSGEVYFTMGNADSSQPPAAPTRSVVESDIWKVQGDTLFFFNQNRGLQVIDIANPDAPLLRGTLPLPAAGEQMYVLDDTHVVLLTHGNCGWSVDAENLALVVEVVNGLPSVTAYLPIKGNIQESRLVGTALYVASQTYRPLEGDKNGSWEWGTVISAFDLADPAAPVSKPTLWYAGSGYTVTTTERFFFVSGQEQNDWTRSVIRCVDISAPDGTLKAAGSLKTFGQINDKFKMNLSGDIFTAISFRWISENANGGDVWRPLTKVETFTLADPALPQKMGELEVGHGEQLFATRFDGDRVYIVTFLRKDPLWIVDLSNPALPQIKGELQVPGWSTYIQPLGDRLVTIGIDDANSWRVAVSLFDVADVSKPALLSKVPLGDSYSWSEANGNEKAFGVLPEAGLLLVPFSSYSTNNYQGVQLIDLQPNSLTKRGFIAHDVQARRATEHKGRVFSISSQELLSVDATDRDHPVVRATLELSWPADRVFAQGDYLVEMANARYYYGYPNVPAGGEDPNAPKLRVVAAANPEAVLSRLSLANLPVLGATAREQRLYILQGLSQQIIWPVMAAGEVNQPPPTTNAPSLRLTVFDLTNLPEIKVLGQTDVNPSGPYWNNLEAMWPHPNVLVWASSEGGFWGGWWGRGGIDVLTVGRPAVGGGASASYAAVGRVSASVVADRPAPFLAVATPGESASFVALDRSLWGPWNWVGGGLGQLAAFDVSDGAVPKFLSEVNLTSTNGGGGNSKAYTVDGLVYLSHQDYDSQITGTNYYTYNEDIHTLVTNIVTTTNLTKVPHYITVTNIDLLTENAVFVVNSGPAIGAGNLTANRIATGGFHNLTLPANGSVFAWGANDFGQLGDSVTEALAAAKVVLNLTDVIAISAGGHHSLALKADGTAWAWGADLFGQLGNGGQEITGDLPPLPETGSPIPAQVAGLNNLNAVVAGTSCSFALQSDGTVWAWGGNQYGQLGDGTTTERHSPVAVADLSGVRALAGGAWHSLALKIDGTVWAWGRNHFGQLGDGAKEDRSTPAPVPGLDGIVAIAAGVVHNLALKSDGTVWAWGANDRGQLGDGSLADRNSVMPVPGLVGVTSIAAGGWHNLAFKSDGSVWVWGANDAGQLGDGSTKDANLARLVEGIDSVAAVAAGRVHSLAARSDGTLWAWGDNTNAQLSDGAKTTIEHSYSITNVSTITEWTEVPEATTYTNITKVVETVTHTNAVPIVEYFQRHYLDVVDFNAPEEPTVRPPINLPGALKGVSTDGELLFTVGQHASNSKEPDWRDWIDVSAYDGVSVSLIDSMVLPTEWPHPVLVQGANIFLGRPAPGTNTNHSLEAWTLPESGELTQLSAVSLEAPAQNLVAFGGLLAVQLYGDAQLFDITNPTAPKLIGSGGAGGCLGYNLDYADGSLERGLWVPLGYYGVIKISVTPPPAP